MDHCLSNTLTIESLSRNVEVTAFAEYSSFSIPTGGPAAKISDVKRGACGHSAGCKIRAGGDVTAFTVRPAAEYSDYSKLTVNGYDCLTSGGKATNCRAVSARKNADRSYTVTLTGVTGVSARTSPRTSWS